jgi:subtilisin
VARAIEAHRDEVLVVAAAGNDGPDLETLATPAAHEAVLAVGAIDREGRVIDASSRGRPGEEFCACRGAIDVVAAGDGVTTTGRHAGYRRMTGTSIAAGQVAGVAAKAWASGRADLNRDGTVAPAEVRRWIRTHARDVTRGSKAGPGYDPASGAGLPIVD